MSKKMISILITGIALILLFSFVLACGGTEGESDVANKETITEEKEAVEEPEPELSTETENDDEELIETETGTYTVEYILASLDYGEPIEEDDPIIDEYSVLLDSLMEKTNNNRISISDITVTTSELLADEGIYMSLLDILRDLNDSIPEESPKLDLEEVAAAYVVLLEANYKEVKESAEELEGATLGEKNALQEALDYLDYTAFSYSGLIDQLKYEGYSHEEAAYGVDNCGADWNEQAARSALDYLDYTAFSYSGLVEQLEYEGFTHEEAVYGVDRCGADWNEQAAIMAQDYLDYSSFSRAELIAQLEYEGFTPQQAEYGVQAVGY